MEGYTSEQEQVEAIKKWWQENGTSVIAGAVIGLGVIFGWKYYQGQQVEQAEAASALYEGIAASAVAGAEDLAPAASELRQKYPDSPYSVLAAFASAKESIEANNLVAAAESLRWVVENSPQKELKHLAKWRLAVDWTKR